MRHDAMLMVRADLLGRIENLAAVHGRSRRGWLVQEIDTIRHIAQSHGMEPLERLASMLESTLSYHGAGAIILSYIDLMRDAAGCEEVGPQVAETYMAALSLRMGA